MQVQPLSLLTELQNFCTAMRQYPTKLVKILWNFRAFSPEFLKSLKNLLVSGTLREKNPSGFITVLRSPHVHKKAQTTYVTRNYQMVLSYTVAYNEFKYFFWYKYLINICKKNIQICEKTKLSLVFTSVF